MTAEQLIEQILSCNHEVSKEEIMERLEKEKRKTNGLILEETLLRMIAAEFGMQVQNICVSPLTLSVSDLVPSLNHVTVIGRVIAAFPSKVFNGRKSGKFASFLIADETGILRVVLWNDKTELLESGEIKVGQIIRISHGYTKEGQGGEVELHIGEKCKIEINPEDADAKNYPTASKFTLKIKEVTHSHKSSKVNVSGTVKKLFSTSTFERQDSSIGKVTRIVLADETGEISTVVWNEKVDELEENLKKGTKLRILGAKVRKALNEGLEIHVDSGTYMELLTSAEEFLKIADLQLSSGTVSVEGRVASKPTFREVKTFKEELVKLASFELMGETSRVWVSAWRKHAETVRDFKIGDRIVIKDAYVKRGFCDQLELSTRESTSMIVVR
jgi:replication factor A1